MSLLQKRIKGHMWKIYLSSDFFSQKKSVSKNSEKKKSKFWS